MVEVKKYSQIFFEEMEVNSLRSARVIIPLVDSVINPQSVVDIGCGTGAWLKVWTELKQDLRILGVDGPYIPAEMLRIPETNFIAKDLKAPLEINGGYDLVMSLEVGEHLPENKSHVFVQSLVDAGEVILFSAAIPGQTGTYHINEQYPEYWAAIFKQFDYVPVDFVRPNVWNNPDVEFYYKQNILLFVKKSALGRYPKLASYAEKTDPEFLVRIHPFLLELKQRQINNTKTFFGYINWRWYRFKRKYIHKDPGLNGT